MQSLAYVLPDFRSFSTVDYVAYGFNIPMNQLAQDLTVCLAYLVGPVRHRILLPADARGGQMTERTSFYRKLAYLASRSSCWRFPSSGSARRRPPRKPGGKLAQLRNEHQPRPGEPRRSRPGQRNDQAGHARPARRGRQPAVGEGQLLQEDRRLDQPHRHARATRQAAAELHHVLEVSGLESDVQRLGRVRRLPRSLLLRSPRHRVPARKASTTTPTIRSCCGTWAGSSARRSAGPTSTCNIAGCSRQDDDFHPADRTPDERDNWLVGKEWYLTGDRRGRQQGQEPRPQEPARSSIPARPCRR